MKSYRYAIQWIARNDEPAELDAGAMKGLLSVCLVADLSSKSPSQVAGDVVKCRLASKKRRAKKNPMLKIHGHCVECKRSDSNLPHIVGTCHSFDSCGCACRRRARIVEGQQYVNGQLIYAT